jgi:nicotinamide-nucleotide amidase
MTDDELIDLAAQLGRALQAREWKLATAESCTGGWVAKLLTDIAGSSAWFDRGFVTYSDAAKRELLDVRAATLKDFGAVSEQTARELASGALGHSPADVSLAITGIAGPGGGSPDKPVGLVWFAWARRSGAVRVAQQQFSGDREAVRRQAVAAALQGVLCVFNDA